MERGLTLSPGVSAQPVLIYIYLSLSLSPSSAQQGLEEAAATQDGAGDGQGPVDPWLVQYTQV